MPSRQDELHSYQYSVQRVVAALVSHDPDPHRSPLRRAGVTALVGLLVAALTVGGFAVYGVFTGHSMAEANDPNSVLVEKKTGARYVYLESDGKLHPVLNYTSGLLLAGGTAPALKNVPAEKLARMPLGEPLGIPEAPDSLPAAKSLLAGAWSVCSDTAGGRPRSTLLVGSTPSGGAALSGGLLVRDPSGRTHLVNGSQRHLLPAADVDTIQRALGWYGTRPWVVSTAWIDAVPAGADLAPPTIPNLRKTSVIAGRRVGQVLTGDGKSFAVVLSDGIAPLTELQAKLLAGATATPISAGIDLIGLPGSKSGLSGSAEGLPASVPALAEAPASACVTLPGDGIKINPTIPAGVAPPGAAHVDLVHVARGKGAVVEATASPDAPADSGTVSLVTDSGRQHALASRDLLGRLGYASVRPTRIPAQLVAYLPAGPALDPVRAGRR
ncbi:type VII secretion protein EccB [Actinoplanes sp. NEAU-A12]|uniref:Type VII secretion protein EccB n=1 Tax=Actinoplanes sandaracinus TaxID=3045177 RepID=A0ABT6WHP0_9ACTN|nr:type VII secretion protein EccB [Actinoplanes sandaracinus]MDI6099200.1 type VII secretion protein EccB [Actinoplanes sandaracinus]